MRDVRIENGNLVSRVGCKTVSRCDAQSCRIFTRPSTTGFWPRVEVSLRAERSGSINLVTSWSIDRLLCFDSVFDKRFFSLVFGPGLELRAVAAKLVQRHPVTAGVGDSGQMNLDE